MFGAPYPGLERTLVCARGTALVFVHTDFDFAEIPREVPFCPVRLSPVIQETLGRSGMGEVMLAMASVAHTLTQNLETIHSFIELIVTDNRLEPLGWEPGELVGARDLAEKRFLDLAPPSHKAAPVEDCVEWYEHCKLLLERAASPDSKPVEAIPWY
jgi:hypothetical protein